MVVMGVGFVGAVMAGVVADTVDPETGEPTKFVIGMQRPSSRSFWKIAYLNEGVAPVEAEDPEVAPLIRRCVKEKKTLTATFTYEALTLADVVVVDVQCDYQKECLGNVVQGYADIKALEESLRVIGEKIPPECLVLIETTVPPGTTEYVAYPIIKKAFEERGMKEVEPLLAHSFERVMPGREYVASIRDFWRVCSGINEKARDRVRTFLSQVLNVKKFPLTVLDRPLESETCKIVENSYRATILAYLHEWSLFAERNGVDLIKVLEAIRVRPTHSNIIFPGTRDRRVLSSQRRGPGGLGLPHAHGVRRRYLPDHPAGHQHQRHPGPACGRDRPRRPAEYGSDRGRLQNRRSGGFLPGRCGGYAIQRVRNHGPETYGNGGRDRRPRSVCKALVGTGETGYPILPPENPGAGFSATRNRLRNLRGSAGPGQEL